MAANTINITKKLAIDNEMTVGTAARVNSLIMDHLPYYEEIEVDLSGVTRIDSAGFQIMLVAKLEAAQMRKKIRFVRHSNAILEILSHLEEKTFLGDSLQFVNQQNDSPIRYVA